MKKETEWCEGGRDEQRARFESFGALKRSGISLSPPPADSAARETFPRRLIGPPPANRPSAAPAPGSCDIILATDSRNFPQPGVRTVRGGTTPACLRKGGNVAAPISSHHSGEHSPAKRKHSRH